jgi:choline monooxygenase
VTPPQFEVHPDITRAHTPPAALYLDPAAYTQMRERVFARSWHWLGRPADEPGLSEPGALSPLSLLPGLLDEPLLWARDEAGHLRLLSNVCTHRGKLLVEAPCQAKEIRCGYHSRRYTLDGRLRFMPGFEGVCNFPAARDDLPALQFGELGGHAFATLGRGDTPPLLPLQDWLAPVAERLAFLLLHTWQPDPQRSRDYSFDAHWALYVENYLEGLHIPFVHPALNGTLDMAQYHYECWPGGVLQRAEARPGEAAFEPPPGHPDHGRRIAAWYFWLFPNLMLNVYPWGLSVNRVMPLGPARTCVQFRSYVADPALLGQGAGGALDTVELEDEAVVLGVQQGLRSRLYTPGRYAVQHEVGVHHFHRLLCAAMNDV